MKRLFILVILLAMMPFAGTNAQDARNRVTSTIIADALATLPAETPEAYNKTMDELARTGAEGMETICAMLKPAAEGVNNSAIEYAIHGVASYVSKNHLTLQNGVRAGLKSAINKATNKPIQAFLMTALEVCATAEDAEFYAEKLSDEYLANFAARSLATLKGTEPVVKSLIENQGENGLSKKLLAQIASYKHIPAVEPTLLEWLEGATEEETAQINLALASCGSADAVKTLAAAAADANYAFETTDAYGAYTRILNRMVEENPAVAEKAAKKLMKQDAANVRLEGLDILVQLHGKETTPLVLKALKDDCRQYRYGALRAAEAYACGCTHAAVAEQLAKASDAAEVDILNWLGANHAASQVEAVCEELNDENIEVVCAAIEAASRIGGDSAAEAIFAKVESVDPASEEGKTVIDAAIPALLAFNGSVNNGVVKALAGNDASKAVAYAVLGKRRIPEAADAVIASAKGGNAAAQKVLANVATAKDFDALCEIYEAGKGSATAINKAIQDKPAAEQVAAVQARMAKAADKKHLYYPVLASTGSEDVIPVLVAGYKEGNKDGQAFASMLSVNSDKMIEPLYEVATSNAELKDQALARYIRLTQSSRLNNDRKYMNYRKALETKPSVAVQNQALTAMAATQNYQGMMLAAEYMDNEATAQAAANTVMQIATKHPEYYSAEVKALLEKVSATLNDGDAVYKRKDIEKFISENKEGAQHSIITELSEEEKAEGFELLFNGQDMSAWTGNVEAYQPVNGAMYVTASYGSTGNLYTKKEYADFVFRFEFCFDREGVNNGVGIRTPMGVDAAYHGMEIQVLHHDAPIYAGLREYQVHGSVYGIIPAKRIKWGPLGEWHTEEIRIKGDNIKVTVDGEVILEGNIRKACQGHNVAPDGGYNKYTVDHLNHPGLFNKKGHIGFLGHGQGIKYRHVRVKEL
ncbi:MAG: DUF1080 domain-containing protein [Alistipes sp.]|nr:DUF1080 domain-containing protein [Alistipes sp.]